MSGQRGIDHLVVAVGDLAAARERFTCLGFRTTPLGRHPWGTANHLAQFRHSFIELLGVVDRDALVPTSDTQFSFGAHNAEFLRRREGLSMLVLSTDDARADADTWRARGLRVYEPDHWSRKATLPDGSETTVAFTLAFVVDPLMPEMAFFSCQQHNPEAFWKPEYQAHPNGATGIAGVTLVAEEPVRHREFLAALLDDADIDEDADALTLRTAHGTISVLTAAGFAARFPGVRPVGGSRGAVLMAAGIEVADLERAGRSLEENRIPFSVGDSAIHVDADHCCGLVLELTATKG